MPCANPFEFLDDSHNEPLPTQVELILSKIPSPDASFSEKVPLEQRYGGMTSLIRALRRTFLEDFDLETLWSQLATSISRSQKTVSETER